MELTIGSKSLATSFFIIEVQGNYNVILGHDWFHAKHCIHSTLHQFLIQWINNKIEVVHMNVSAYIALANATADCSMGALSAYRGGILQVTTFLASPRNCPHVCEAGFRSSAQQCNIPMSMQKNIEWLRHCTEQYWSSMTDMCEAIEDFDEVEKLGQGFSSADPLEEIDIGDGITPWLTFVNDNMSLEHKDALIKLRRDYIDYFTWNYCEMPGLS
jgi:hypothetical protein